MKKQFEDYHGYRIDSTGKVFKRNGQLLSQHLVDGYKVVYLYKKGKVKKFKVHRLVALLFISNPNNYKYINHIDGHKTNNNVINLEWCTAKYNMRHAFDNKLINTNKEVLQYNLENVFIAEHKSIHKASLKSQIPASNISACCNSKRKQAGGYIWKFK